MKKQNNPKLEQIVKTAHQLFFRYGIRRVSIEEICRTANVSKMTFYKYFKNKKELVKHLFNKLYEEGFRQYYEIMDQDIPYSEKIKQVINWKLAQQETMSQEFIREIMQNQDPELREFIQHKQNESIKIFLANYIEAQKRGDIRKDIKPEFIHYFLNVMTELYRDQKLVHLYDSPKELTSELLNFLFYGILTRK